MRCFKFSVVTCLALFVFAAALRAEESGWGSRLRNLSWFKSSDAAPPGAANSHVPVAPSQSQTTFAPNPLAPRPSVTIPSATSPAGQAPRVARSERPAFGSRLWSAAASAREALTIKPREVPAPDPVSLSTSTVGMEAPVFVSAARVYEMQGRLKDAREHYEKALAADGKNLEALIGLARLEHREGDLVAATEMYQRALRAHPNNAVVLNDLGLCYARRQMLQQAEQSMANAVKQDPKSKLYRNNLALVLVEMNRGDEALEQLMSVHSEAVAHYNLAYLLREKGRYDAAADHLRTALRADPGMEPARAMLASLNPAPSYPDRGHLGQPEMDLRRPAPVIDERQPRRELPASYRHGAANNSPADVGPVRVRFDNGTAADYRGGPSGSSPTAPATPYPQPDSQRNSPRACPSPAAQNQYDSNYNSGDYDNREHYNGAGASVYRSDRPQLANPSEPPVPGNMPDYLRGNEYQRVNQYQRANDAPQTGGSQTGGSRWTSP